MSWTIKKAECWRTDAFKLWCRRRLLRVPWTARRSNQSILKEISPEYTLEGLMLKLKLQAFGHLIWSAHSLEKTLILGKMEGKRRRGLQRVRWLDSIMDLMDMILSKLWDREGQGSLACWSLWGRQSQTWLSNWTTAITMCVCVHGDGLCLCAPCVHSACASCVCVQSACALCVRVHSACASCVRVHSVCASCVSCMCVHSVCASCMCVHSVCASCVCTLRVHRVCVCSLRVHRACVCTLCVHRACVCTLSIFEQWGAFQE